MFCKQHIKLGRRRLKKSRLRTLCTQAGPSRFSRSNPSLRLRNLLSVLGAMFQPHHQPLAAPKLYGVADN
jgi:hypothetical protein